jgi:hypothetical protein
MVLEFIDTEVNDEQEKVLVKDQYILYETHPVIYVESKYDLTH